MLSTRQELPASALGQLSLPPVASAERSSFSCFAQLFTKTAVPEEPRAHVSIIIKHNCNHYVSFITK